MTPDDVEFLIRDLYARRPGKELVSFTRFDIGGPDRPWSIPGGPYISKFPSLELWDNANYAKRLKWQLPPTCKRVFGLGSLYVYAACTDNHALYVGRAGDTPAQFRIFDEIKSPVGNPLSFPNHCWLYKRGTGDPQVVQEAKNRIESGSFWVACFVNTVPWGTFPDPYAKDAKVIIHLAPFTNVSADLEAWIMQNGQIPPLNTRDERRRSVVVDRAWGRG